LPEQIADYDPPNPKFDGASFTWSFTNHEPPTNPTLTFLRPSVWNDLLARRRAVQQNPNDANAHSSLGGVLRQLSAADSTRRDSYYAQAIAELETAVRLDPNQRSARQMLGVLYESRAGPPAGPRQTNYVLLATAQWETLASSDTSARKQLAEDYFYLGLDAQTRSAFPDALSYFDKAASLAPGGAGPLFTADRAAAQRRSLNIAWARDYLDKDNFPGASEKARLALGEAFIKSFYPPPFYVTFAGVTMSASSREMVFRLVPFASQAAELQKALNGIAEPLRRIGVEAGIAPVPESSDLELAITVQFTNSSDLDQKLAAIAQTIPDSPEWALVHTVVFPQALAWSAPGGWIMNSSSYQEQVDLSPACGVLEKQLENIAQALKPLDSAPATDAEAQLKQALLKNAQSGWQRALAQGRVRYRSGSDETNVDACTARTVAFAASPLRIEFVVVLAVISGGLLGLGILYVEWRRKIAQRNKLRHTTDKPL
jgi:tetratricopeptide (TPR) repeat protein